MDHPLDNQIWHALTGAQIELSLAFGEVRLFRPEIAPAVGMARITAANLSTLAAAIPIDATVITHSVRGRGYAKMVVSAIAQGIVGRGDTPYLMVMPENTPAVRLYESLGFEPRRLLYFNALKRVA